MNPSDNTGKVMTRHIQAKDGTTVALHYPAYQAQALRSLVQRIRLKGDRKPSLSLFARRAMQVYLDHIESSPRALEAERLAMEKMVTPVPVPAKFSKRKPNQ